MGHCLFFLHETDILLYSYSILFHSILFSILIFLNTDQDPTTISVHFSWFYTCALKRSRSQVTPLQGRARFRAEGRGRKKVLADSQEGGSLFSQEDHHVEAEISLRRINIEST